MNKSTKILSTIGLVILAICSLPLPAYIPKVGFLVVLAILSLIGWALRSIWAQKTTSTTKIKVTANSKNDSGSDLIKLKELLEMGIISSNEFKDKKQKLENKKKAVEELRKQKLEAEQEKEDRAAELKKMKIAKENLKSLKESGVLTLKEYNAKLKKIEGEVYKQSHLSKVIVSDNPHKAKRETLTILEDIKTNPKSYIYFLIFLISVLAVVLIGK